MKIMIIGYSGSGKSTLARKLGDYYKIPILHIDTIFFNPNWIEKSYEEVNQSIKMFLDNNTSWVIDGNYSKHFFERRAMEADLIIYMNFNRITCLINVYKRYFKYKGKNRESCAIGCDEKVDFDFVKWVLFRSRTKKRKEKYKILKDKYPEKFVEIRSRKEQKKWMKKLTLYHYNDINA